MLRCAHQHTPTRTHARIQFKDESIIINGLMDMHINMSDVLVILLLIVL
jgi:hypothetical protein